MKRSLEKEKRLLAAAVAKFSKAMLFRLFKKAEQGFRGWDGKYSKWRLWEELQNDSFHCNKPVDIANRAMMIWVQAGAWGKE